MFNDRQLKKKTLLLINTSTLMSIPTFKLFPRLIMKYNNSSTPRKIAHKPIFNNFMFNNVN